MESNVTDYVIATGMIIALLIVGICYIMETRRLNRQERSWFEGEWFNYPPPPGSTRSETIEWHRLMKERKLNKQLPIKTINLHHAQDHR